MEIPDFIDPDEPDFQGRMVQIHNIKEHLDMLLFAAYASVIDRFFRDHDGVKAIIVTNASDRSDDGRFANIQEVVREDGEYAGDDTIDALADEINELRDRGIYGGLDAMFERGLIGRDNVMGQFRECWVKAEGDSGGKRWDVMVAATAKARLDAGTSKATAGGAGPRI